MIERLSCLKGRLIVYVSCLNKKNYEYVFFVCVSRPCVSPNLKIERLTCIMVFRNNFTVFQLRAGAEDQLFGGKTMKVFFR